MMSSVITKLKLCIQSKDILRQIRTCHSVFGIKELLQPDKLDHFIVSPVTVKDHGLMLNFIQQHYIPNHVLVRDRKIDMSNDSALVEYILNLLKQGNSLSAKTSDGAVAGLCVNYASCPNEPRNLRNYAFYRQDLNTKDFLYFAAKMQETPNLWDIFKQSKVFEMKMLAVLPEYRRQGLAVLLTEKTLELVADLNYSVVRMDCINPHEFIIQLGENDDDDDDESYEEDQTESEHESDMEIDL